MDWLLFAREVLLECGSRSYISGQFDQFADRGLDGGYARLIVYFADR
jgi:hypothetical protein